MFILLLNNETKGKKFDIIIIIIVSFSKHFKRKLKLYRRFNNRPARRRGGVRETQTSRFRREYVETKKTIGDEILNIYR